jgi:hypothetical protein
VHTRPPPQQQGVLPKRCPARAQRAAHLRHDLKLGGQPAVVDQREAVAVGVAQEGGPKVEGALRRQHAQHGHRALGGDAHGRHARRDARLVHDRAQRVARDRRGRELDLDALRPAGQYGAARREDPKLERARWRRCCCRRGRAGVASDLD